MAGPNTSYDELSTMVNDFFIPRHREVVFREHPFLDRVPKKFFTGGDKIRQTLTYQFTKDGAFFDYETGSTANQDKFTPARYEPKLYRQHLTISVPELRKSSGPESIFSMLDEGTKAQMRAIRDAANTDMLFYLSSASPVAYGDSDKQVHGLVRLLGDNTYPVASDTVGEIPKSNTWWRGVVKDAAAAFNANVRTSLNDLWWGCVDGGLSPDMWITHNDRCEAIDNAADQNERYVNIRTQDVGAFPVVAFVKGKPVYADLACNTDHVFALRTDDFTLWSGRVHRSS